MSDFYGPRDDAQSMDTLERALELGVTFWDTSDAYGPHRNEELVGKAIRGRRDKVVIATKFGIVRKLSDPTYREINGRRSTCGPHATRASSASVSIRSISTTSIASTPTLPSRTPSARWRSW